MQSSFSDLEHTAKKKQTRAGIEAVTPWSVLEVEIEPFYPKGEGRGRPPIGLTLMIWIVLWCGVALVRRAFLPASVAEVPALPLFEVIKITPLLALAP